MKITEGQYFEVEDFLKDQCKLTETEFIEEMVDHFVNVIEQQTATDVPFDDALNLVVENFGGKAMLRKMEWSFQKTLMKRTVREWWSTVMGYTKRPMLYRTIASCITVTALSVYLCFYTPNQVSYGSFLRGFLIGTFLPAISYLAVYLLGRRMRWFPAYRIADNITRIASSCLFSVCVMVTIPLFLLILEFTQVILLKAILCSILWTIASVVLLALFDFSKKIDHDEWYQPYKLS